jgi:hypothetical protein
VRGHQPPWVERHFRHRTRCAIVHPVPLTPLGRRLLEELTVITQSGGGVNVGIAAAQWLGAYNLDVVQRALVVAVEEGVEADVLDLLAGVAGSLRTACAQPADPVTG